MSINISKDDLMAEIKDAFKRRLESYAIRSHIDKKIDDYIEDINPMLIEAFSQLNGDKDFQQQIKLEIQNKLAKRCGELATGMIDKSFEKLRQIPTFNDRLKLKVHEVLEEFINFKDERG